MPNPTTFTFVNHAGHGEDATVPSVGGEVILMKANADLLVGDAVYIQDSGEVDKSTTAGNYLGFCGVVVGGTNTGMECVETVGISAANANEYVWVQRNGIARCIAGAAITAGTNFAVGPSGAVAGRVIAATTGHILGKALTDAGAAADPVLVLIEHIFIYTP